MIQNVIDREAKRASYALSIWKQPRGGQGHACPVITVPLALLDYLYHLLPNPLSIVLGRADLDTRMLVGMFLSPSEVA